MLLYTCDKGKTVAKNIIELKPDTKNTIQYDTIQNVSLNSRVNIDKWEVTSENGEKYNEYIVDNDIGDRIQQTMDRFALPRLAPCDDQQEIKP